MNKTIKIILLLLAIIGAVRGVMVYYQTIVMPPGKLSFNNQYVISDQEDIARTEFLHRGTSIDSNYIAVTHELDFQLSNNKLTNQERDELLKSFTAQYVPIFASFCDSKFHLSNWDEQNLKSFYNRTTEINSLVTTDQKIIIDSESRSLLNGIYNVINNYYDAKRAAAADGYKGLQSAQQRIETAKRYASMYPINKCLDLYSRLNSVPSRLEQAHFDYLYNQVEKLKSYSDYNQSEYDSIAIFVLEILDEYRENARSTYGYMSDIRSLENRAGYYYTKANFY